MLGYHEQLVQAPLHDAGKALIVQAHQGIVQNLQHCGYRRQRGGQRGDTLLTQKLPQPPRFGHLDLTLGYRFSPWPSTVG